MFLPDVNLRKKKPSRAPARCPHNPLFKTLTLRRRHICNSDASDLRVTEAQQKRPVGSVLEDEVQVLLPDEAKYQPSGETRWAQCRREGASRRGQCLTLRSSSSSDASWWAPSLPRTTARTWRADPGELPARFTKHCQVLRHVCSGFRRAPWLPC